jgi:hypothetical protein
MVYDYNSILFKNISYLVTKIYYERFLK